MELKKEIETLGRRFEVEPRAKKSLKGITVDEKLPYRFYDGTYQGTPLLPVEPKKGNSSLRACAITGKRLTEALGLPAVFILTPGPTYERHRLADKGVFSVMSEEYTHLPGIIILERTGNRKIAEVLAPVVQYILLHYLQVGSIEGMSPRGIAPLPPYSYESATLGVVCFEGVGLCQRIQNGQRSKVVHFELKGKGLQGKAQNALLSPVENCIFCDGMRLGAEYPVCGINALAHYFMFDRGWGEMIVMISKEYRTIKSANVMENPNIYDGDYIIEVWKYPVVSKMGDKSQWVDRLSPVLSLRDDDDPRVEREVERMISEQKWKD